MVWVDTPFTDDGKGFWAKLEGHNPGGMKERPALHMLPQANTIDDYTGLRRHCPWLALGLAMCLLGLVGTPPTGVFAGKLTAFTAALDAGLGWLVVVAAINTAAGVFYYLRWIVPAMRSGSRSPPPGHDHRLARHTALAIGLLVGPALALVDTGLVPAM